LAADSTVSLVAGNGSYGAGPDGALATQTPLLGLYEPDLRFAPNGDLYFYEGAREFVYGGAGPRPRLCATAAGGGGSTPPGDGRVYTVAGGALLEQGGSLPVDGVLAGKLDGRYFNWSIGADNSVLITPSWNDLPSTPQQIFKIDDRGTLQAIAGCASCALPGD